ncbi:MAG: phosphatidate cytidylyltransferase, partial [Betaproteobacteria bacterium]|nr:phosphatidate cytidylyltransferase [Betaproteobacteria bacterium]
MLKTRVITALAALPMVLLPLFVLPRWVWGVFIVSVAMIACWEWTQFCALSSRAKKFYLALSALILGLTLLGFLATSRVTFDRFALIAFSLSAVFWVTVVPLWLVRQWRPVQPGWILLSGWLVIIPFALSFLYLYEWGPWLVFAFVVIVWIADIAAYFAGRSLGRHKLAPAISPGKTIEGAIGGVVGVVGYFFILQALLPIAESYGQGWAVALRSQGYLLLGLFVLLAPIS